MKCEWKTHAIQYVKDECPADAEFFYLKENGGKTVAVCRIHSVKYSWWEEVFLRMQEITEEEYTILSVIDS